MSFIDPTKLKTVSNDRILQIEDSFASKLEHSDESLNKQLNSESQELEQQLKDNATKNDHTRDQKWKDHFSFAFIFAFWILCVYISKYSPLITIISSPLISVHI